MIMMEASKASQVREGSGSVANEEGAMLRADPVYIPPTEEDRRVFELLVPSDHYLRRAAQFIDFERFRSLMASCYSPDQGRPALEPVLLLKLSFLEYHDRLSDKRAVDTAQVNVAYREFLDLSMTSDLPDPSLLCRFRARLGAEKFAEIFHGVLAQAREHGLLKDRLRLKDATHVIADVAVPATIALVAAVRNRLLDALAPYDAEWVEGQRIQAEMIRNDSAGAADEQRLELRVTHLREIIAWTDDFVARQEGTPVTAGTYWQRLKETLSLAHKVLSDREHPEAGDALASLEDPDARFGRHCGPYCGYLLDIAMDADSELITSVIVPASNGDEAADAALLIRQEEEAHGNDVEALSADGVLCKGERLRELTDPEGLNLKVFVPVPPEPPTEHFTAEDFRLDEAGQQVTCPAGQQSSRRDRSKHDTGWIYRFRYTVCSACPLHGKCMAKLPKCHGRSVIKNDYAAEYAAARARTKTPEFEAVRRDHRKVERKLGEMVRHHRSRRARYRGRPKVLVQQLMTALVVNVKRMVKILCAEPARAEE
jgi:transposase